MKILKAPYLSSFSSEGVKLAPNKIIDLLSKENSINESGKPFFMEVEEVPEKSFDDKIKSFQPQIILGGSHSITTRSFTALHNENNDAGIIIFDAHPDSCNPINNEDDLIPSLIKKGVNPKNIILVGVRKVKKEEKEFLTNNSIRIIDMKTIFNNGISNVCDGIMETARQWPLTYLSIDMDVMDPSCAPGTEALEPGGLNSREMIYFIQRLKLMKNLRMVDFVELDPSKDINNMTSKLIVKLIKELA